MTRTSMCLAAAALAVATAACSDPVGDGGDAISAEALAASLSTSIIGQGDLSSSYVGAEAARFRDEGFAMAGGHGARFDHTGMMGGGLDGAFVGDPAAGRGFGAHGPFGGGIGCRGTFNAATGRVECPPVVMRGLTVTRSAQYLTAAGAVQQAWDSATTSSVDVRASVTGTVTFTADSLRADSAQHHGRPGRHGGPAFGRLLGDTARILTATTVVTSQSQRTTTGLAAGSTQRTISGTSSGRESTTGTSTRGAFTATRTQGDTTRSLVVPTPTAGNPRPHPTGGSVTRAMSVSLTVAGAAPVSVTRREVVTYDGSATATVVITVNGTTRNCTRPLPRGPLSCS